MGKFKLIKKIILENQDIQITFKLNKKNMWKRIYFS